MAGRKTQAAPQAAPNTQAILEMIVGALTEYLRTKTKLLSIESIGSVRDFSTATLIGSSATRFRIFLRIDAGSNHQIFVFCPHRGKDKGRDYQALAYKSYGQWDHGDYTVDTSAKEIGRVIENDLLKPMPAH